MDVMHPDDITIGNTQPLKHRIRDLEAEVERLAAEQYDERMAAWRNWRYGPVHTDPSRYVLRAMEEMGELCVAAGVDEETAVARLQGAYAKERERGTDQPDPANIRVECAQVACVLMGCGEVQGWRLMEEIGREIDRLEAKRDAAEAAS